MWPNITKELTLFPTAVLSGRDTEGYPASVRTVARADEARQELEVQVAADVDLQPGPASLLLHDHDEQLWNQRVFLVRGNLRREGQGWIFHPEQIAPGLRNEGPLDIVKAVINLRKVASAYLRKRGLARPVVPWDRLKAIKGKA